MHVFSALILAILLGTTMFAQDTAAPSAKPAEPTASHDAANSEIRIGISDLLEIRVYGVPDLAQTDRVSSTGEIYMPLVGTVKVVGLTTEEAARAIQNKLRDGGYLRDPQVTILTREFATQGITVIGEVSKPGVYAILGDRRLFDAISLAGGTTDKAGRTVTVTRRGRPTEPIQVELNADASKAVASNIVIYPGDTIMVSRAGIVYVVGDVGRPAGFTMDNNEHMTVLQAIALAGGTNPTASLDSAKIIRRTANGPTEVPMPLKKILTAKAEDMPLQAEDVLFVPRNAAKGAMRRSAEAILQVTTGLVVYRR